ncbi:MAG: hypothetical protein WBK95_10025 [Sulfurimonas sp.]|jgi:hypothetical protein|nr:hypothetical protein [Sulfurimonas sp.]MDD5203259.1 hypothetical protein [Sulfurimonas sp.]
MFNFMSEDWFVISLEIVFLLFIFYDAKKYFVTKKKEYLTNIALTVAFFIWAAIPFYNSYITWNMSDKQEVSRSCQQENNQTLCKCLDDRIFKEYSYEAYMFVDKNGSEFLEFVKESTEECLDDSWF